MTATRTTGLACGTDCVDLWQIRLDDHCGDAEALVRVLDGEERRRAGRRRDRVEQERFIVRRALRRVIPGLTSIRSISSYTAARGLVGNRFLGRALDGWACGSARATAGNGDLWPSLSGRRSAHPCLPARGCGRRGLRGRAGEGEQGDGRGCDEEVAVPAWCSLDDRDQEYEQEGTKKIRSTDCDSIGLGG